MKLQELDAKNGQSKAANPLAILKLLADVGAFAWKLFRSPKTPVTAKALLGGIVAYLVSPVDIIPDTFPVLGQMDDMVIAVAALGLAVKLIPRELIEELWDSEVDFDSALESVRAFLHRSKRK